MKKHLMLNNMANYIWGVVMTVPLWNITSMKGFIAAVVFGVIATVFVIYVSFTSAERINQYFRDQNKSGA